MRIKPIYLFTLTFLAVIFGMGLFGCDIEVDVSELVINAKTEIECLEYSENGYIWIANACCLDSNDNNLCDIDERAAQTLCDNECSQPICGGDSKRVFYDCIQKEDGCLDLEAKGEVIGECRIECFSNSDCKIDEWCSNNKCNVDRCGDTSCGLFESCETCPQDCLNENQICCSDGPTAGNCCVDEDCESRGLCESNQCTSCGDGICSENENCSTCPVDCLAESEVCCGGDNYAGNCCLNSDCKGNLSCVSNLCS